MRQNKANTLLKPKFSPDVFEDDDLRIDWERKKLKKDRTEDEIDEELLEVDDDLMDDFEVEADAEWVFTSPKKQQRGKPKKDKRDKRRHLVFDEDSGRVYVKRRRKQNRYDDVWLEDHD